LLPSLYIVKLAQGLVFGFHAVEQTPPAQMLLSATSGFGNVPEEGSAGLRICWNNHCMGVCRDWCSVGIVISFAPARLLLAMVTLGQYRGSMADSANSGNRQWTAVPLFVTSWKDTNGTNEVPGRHLGASTSVLARPFVPDRFNEVKAQKSIEF